MAKAPLVYTGPIAPEEVALSFFDLEPFALACVENAFTAREAHARLIKLARSKDPKVSLAALRELRAAARERLEVRGILATLTSSRQLPANPDGSTIEQSVRTLSMNKDDPHAQRPDHARVHQALRPGQAPAFAPPPAGPLDSCAPVLSNAGGSLSGSGNPAGVPGLQETPHERGAGEAGGGSEAGSA